MSNARCIAQREEDILASKTIETGVAQIKAEGWCLIEGVIPEDRIAYLRGHVMQGHAKALRDYEARGGSLAFQADANGEPSTNAVAYVPDLAPYFGDERVLGIAKAMLDPHVRIAQTEFKTRPQGEKNIRRRGFHSDWPHDILDRDRAGAIRMPFPNVTMGLTALWMLSEFSAENGGTWVVPRSHLDIRNPRSHLDPRNPPHMHDGIDPSAAIPGEMQLQGPAGSVLMLDSRIWHSTANNPSDAPRVTVLTRYSPWWISLEFGGRNRSLVPRDVFENFPDGVKDLYRHRVAGEENPIRKC